jgi:hypothetical protein
MEFTKEKLSMQVANLTQQRDTALCTYHQTLGALAILQEQLKLMDEQEAQSVEADNVSQEE